MRLTLILIVLIFARCTENQETSESKYISFSQPQKVNVTGYDDHIMEPFLSRNGTILFFNNLNQPTVNTNLHFATKINDNEFKYEGELTEANTEDLEGVPSMDNSGVLYFISTRSYDQTLSTIYQGDFSNGKVQNVQLVSGISKKQPGWLNFDVEISKDGKFLYTVDGRFDENGGPYESDLILAIKTNGGFQRAENDILENVNTKQLEYAACISSDMLELYFTRVKAPLTVTSTPQIYMATRNSVNESFNTPYKIEAASGFVEAPTLSPDNQIIYYHKKENEKFLLYMIKKGS